MKKEGKEIAVSTPDEVIQKSLDLIDRVYDFGEDEMSPDCCIGEIPQTFRELSLNLLAIRRMVKQND